MSEPVLVTGGAGYIGAITARHLLEAGHPVVVLDNLCSGRPWAVPDGAELVRGDIADGALVESVLRRHGARAVVHFAAHIVVPESVADPLKYYDNNVAGSVALAAACRRAGVERFVFSSSAAVYGESASVPVEETAPTRPASPYGTTKLVTEWMLRDLAASTAGDAAPFRHVALRYFNVAGAALDGSHGQAMKGATHLIKVACEAACGRREGVTIFGTDYETADGTCVRDYIHVEDLARAHVDALSYLARGGESDVFNCGYGWGYSVREVLNAVREVSGVEFPVREGARRAGDVPVLVASADRIRRVLGWVPRCQSLELICRTAYEWERDGLPARLAQAD